MREAGILLHISSLPGKYGVGTLGKCAYDFVDFLASANQKIWQILPLNPTTYGDCPYSSPSAFAYNTCFIDLDLLAKEELIDKNDLPNAYVSYKADFGSVYERNKRLLHIAYLSRGKVLKEFEEFKKDMAFWLNDYSLYTILKEEHFGKEWDKWYDDFKFRKDHAINWAKEEFKERIDEVSFHQFLFYRQFLKLKKYANKKGIRIMGDMPIYTSYDSADVWSDPNNYQLNNDLIPEAVAGCPPDAFSADGQLWGNPLYDWDYLKSKKYKWWVERVRHQFKLLDIVRIDHFRGFEAYYAIPYGAPNARVGEWQVGPGFDLFKEINKQVPNGEIVAENLGFLTEGVHKLLKKCNYPGMNIFQFELGDGKKVPLLKGYPENNLFYTGTHDNEMLMSFYNKLEMKYRLLVDKTCGITFNDKPNLKIIEYSMNTNCKYVIVPLQDYLGLSNEEGRMNVPGVALGNWTYISKPYDYSKELALYIKNITIKSGR